MATSPLTEAIVGTSTEVARTTTALLREGVYVRALTANIGVVEMAGGEVEVQLNGFAPTAGAGVTMLQQGYELLIIGPQAPPSIAETVPPEVIVSSTPPTDPDSKLWMQI